MASINVLLRSDVQSVKHYGSKYSDLDVRFNVPPSEKDFTQLRDMEAIKNGVRNILSWRRGERIILPEFGNPLYDYIYEEMNDVTIGKMRSELANIFTKWEPRVQLRSLTIVPNPDGNEVYVNMEYIVPSLSSTVFTYNSSLRKQI